MSEETQAGGMMGRAVQVLVSGDTLDEIELAALDKARSVFGADAHLKVERPYLVRDLDPTGALGQKLGTGKAWYASVMVSEYTP